MAEALRLPRMSDTMEEGVVADILINVGDQIKAGDVIAEVETDKATMEWESFQEGTVLHIAVSKGDAVPVEGLFAVLGKKGEDFQAILEEEKNQAKKEVVEESATKEEVEANQVDAERKSENPSIPLVEMGNSTADVLSNASSGGNGARLKASPLAKKIASDNGIDIQMVSGSGDDGRIIKRDIEQFLKSGGSKTADKVAAFVPPMVTGEESFREESVSQMRKTIAKRLAASKFEAPHFYLTMEINMDRTMEARKRINEVAPIKISFNDIIIKAVAAALRKHPKVNSSWLGDKIRYNNHIHIGMAVAVDDGLLVPVIRFADTKTLSHISAESKEMAEKARNKKLQPDEMQGNTFTISNLGMMGIDEFTAIINPPDACILAVGGIKQIPILEDGALKNTNVMKVTLSCDHRVVDGFIGSQFLQTVKGNLEEPVRMMV